MDEGAKQRANGMKNGDRLTRNDGRQIPGQLRFDEAGIVEDDKRATHAGNASARSEDVLLVASEVAEMLRVTTAWIYAETRAGRLPHVRLGRYVRYRRSALDAWLAATERDARLRGAGHRL